MPSTLSKFWQPPTAIVYAVRSKTFTENRNPCGRHQRKKKEELMRRKHLNNRLVAFQKDGVWLRCLVQSGTILTRTAQFKEIST